MGLSEIMLILVIALILFGPEDLPNIARKIAKIYIEIRKVTSELTKEFQITMDSPVDMLNKAFEQTTSPQIEQGNSKSDGKLLTYKDEIPPFEEPTKGKVDVDPLK